MLTWPHMAASMLTNVVICHHLLTLLACGCRAATGARVRRPPTKKAQGTSAPNKKSPGYVQKLRPPKRESLSYLHHQRAVLLPSTPGERVRALGYAAVAAARGHGLLTHNRMRIIFLTQGGGKVKAQGPGYIQELRPPTKRPPEKKPAHRFGNRSFDGSETGHALIFMVDHSGGGNCVVERS